MPAIEVTPRRAWRRPATSVGFAVAYLAAGFLGRQAVLDGGTFAVVWPAAGVAILWFLVQGARPWSLDTLLLAGCAFAANLATGSGIDTALVLLVSNVLQTLLAVDLLRRWCPELWGCGGDRPLDSPWVTARYLLALGIGMAAGATVGIIGSAVTGGELSSTQWLLWFNRNMCGAVAVSTVALLTWHRLSRPRPRPPLVDRGAEGWLELLLASVLTLGIYALAFLMHGLPVAFLLLVATVWVGVRFSVLISVWHSFAFGAAAVVLTLAGHGPFAELANAETAALLAQLFLAILLMSGLFLSTGRDERVLLLEKLRHLHEEAVYQADLLDAVIHSMVEGLAMVKDDGEVVVLNPAAARVLGYASVREVPGRLAEVPGRRMDGAPLSPEEAPSRRAMAGETVQGAEVLLSGADGRDRVLSVSAAPLPPDPETGGRRAVVLVRDATSDHAERVELAAFAGVVAHDLRNPLSAISGWIELIDDELAGGEAHPAKVQEFVDRVRGSTDRMHGLVLHLLTHATSRDGHLSPTRLRLSDAVRRIAAARRAESLVSCGEIPEVQADRVLVDQLLENLIGNALKYVADGVRPDVRVDGYRDRPGWVRITVTDNGIGLPPGEHESIFQEFHRAHAGDYEGTGLGLAIARRIVTRHGGTILARDHEDGGTVFEFTLPEAAVAPVA